MSIEAASRDHFDEMQRTETDGRATTSRFCRDVLVMELVVKQDHFVANEMIRCIRVTCGCSEQSSWVLVVCRHLTLAETAVASPLSVQSFHDSRRISYGRYGPFVWESDASGFPQNSICYEQIYGLLINNSINFVCIFIFYPRKDVIKFSFSF